MEHKGKNMTIEKVMNAHIGRYASKRFDWHAFPSNDGYKDLSRAQARYIGAGGSPKTGDTTTMEPNHFTLSVMYKEPGKYAACHSHEIEEAFFVISGVLTVAWEQDGEVVEIDVTDKDLILNPPWVPHGFRTPGVEPVFMSVMVATGSAMLPRYKYHPKDNPELAPSFGATPEKTYPFDPNSSHPLQQLMAKHAVRFRDQKTEWLPAGFGRKIYVGKGAIQPKTFRNEMFLVPRGISVKPYKRDSEEAYLVIEGYITVGWIEGDKVVEQHLGPKDVIKNPAGQLHYFRNEEMNNVTMMVVIGTAKPDDFEFEAA